MKNKSDCTRRSDCRLCGGNSFTHILSLGNSALANEVLVEPNTEQDVFPLDLYRCDNVLCGSFQMLDEVSPERMFRNYSYVSGTSFLLRQHFQKLTYHLIDILNLKPDDVVCDIASNDGTLIREFVKENLFAIGVEPATNLANKCNLNGLLTINDFFNADVAHKIVKEYRTAKLITAINCMAHIPDLDGIVRGIKVLLDKDGTFVFEVCYLVDILKSGDFSQVYAEHLNQHTIKPLFNLFQRHEMTLYNVERIDNHGGSIRCYVKNEKVEVQNSVVELIELENSLGLYETNLNKSILKGFIKNTQDIKTKLKEKLLELKAQGKTIAGITASAKSTTFLHYLDIGNDVLDRIYDDAPEKINKYSSGKNILIKHTSQITKDNPDYLLCLSYNFVEFMMKKHFDYKGKWIIPLPISYNQKLEEYIEDDKTIKPKLIGV